MFLKICEVLGLFDFPTAYISLFSILWLPVLIVAVKLINNSHKNAYRVLALIPTVNFVVFYILNYTKGYPITGILRYGPHLIAALVYCLATLIMSRSSKRVKPLVISGILCVLISAFTAGVVLADSYAWHFGNFSHYSYEKSMAALIDELEQNYILSGYKGVDFEELRAVYIPLAAEAERNGDEVAFAYAVTNLCYEFHDGHLRQRYNDIDLRNEVVMQMAGNDYGFSMIRLDDGSVIAMLTDEESEAYASGIRNGVVITSWDGVDIDTAVDDVRCLALGIRDYPAYPIEANEDVMRPIYLAGQGGDTVEVGFIDEDGNEQVVTVASQGSYCERLSAAIEPLTGKRCEEFGYACMLDDRTGYLCIPEEGYEDLLDLRAAMTDEYPEVRDLIISRIEELKAQGMETLILDLRDNDGGIDVVYEEIVALFTNEAFVTTGGFYNDTEFEASDNWIWSVEPDGRYSDLPVVTLVNCGCGSCGDIFASYMSRCPNATVMGITTTWGSAQTMGGQCLLSDGQIYVSYPVMATLDENGEVYLDAGPDRVSSVELDVRIPLDREAVEALYNSDEDYELDFAVQYLADQ